MALVKKNPQNELADIIPEPSAEINSFRVIIQIVLVILVQKVGQAWGLEFISMFIVKINPRNELGDIMSEPYEKLNSSDVSE